MEARGFAVYAAGLGERELTERFRPYWPELARLPIPERRRYNFTWRFARFDAPAKLDELIAAVRSFRPDLLVFDSADIAAPIAAAACGVESANHSFGRIIPADTLATADPEVEPLWRRLGLEPEPLCGSYRGAYIDICPPAFRTNGPPAGTPVVPLRPEFPPASGERAPDWLDTLPASRPTVYVTLGTIRNDPTIFRVILGALAGLDANVIATIGAQNDPAALGEVPANAIVAPYVSQSFVLERADVVVSHAGSGSTLGAFAHGVPMVLLPQAADQFENAAQVAALGAGLALLPEEVDEESLLTSVATLLADASYAEHARAVADEIARMPAAADVAAMLSA